VSKEYIDLQVNGYGGISFGDENLNEDMIRQCFDAIKQGGTKTCCPTMITSSMQLYKRNIPLILKVGSEDKYRRLFGGLHLEGPFLCATEGAIGAHDPKLVIEPTVAEFDRFYDLCEGKLSILTVAADAEGICDVISRAVKCGVAVSLGHENANDDHIRAAVDAGATLLTHLGNGIPNMIHRHKNPILSGLAFDELTAMIITDGWHLPDSLIKVIVRTKGPEKVIVTSDAAPVAGLEPGRYQQFGREVVLEENGLLRCADADYLAGSSANMTRCMEYLTTLNLLDEKQLDMVGIQNPAKILGIE
jgi:N-acetylglucosamine-6-phosphate deacetylase